MRIRELLESNHFDEKDYVTPTDGGREINFDLVEDLVHFMHNDDHVYRRHIFPTFAKVMDHKVAKKSTKSDIFQDAVKESYKKYIHKFPIRELPDVLDDETCKKVCEKIHDEMNDHIKAGKYKDYGLK
jgi:hypothetical protein